LFAPTVPAVRITERVAIETRGAEIVQPVKVLRNKLVVRRLITFELIMFLSASGAVAAGIAAECVVPILLVCRLAVAVYAALGCPCSAIPLRAAPML
jgi:hypothetical protein